MTIAIPKVKLSDGLRAYIWLVAISIMFLGQIAVPVSDFPINIVLILYFTTMGLLVRYGLIRVAYVPLAIYVLFVTIGVAGIARHSGATVSQNSLVLFAVLHLPFIFDPAPSWKLKKIVGYFGTVWIRCSICLAVIAIAHFFIMNALHIKSLTNIYFLIPDGLHQVGGYNYSYVFHGLYKANGFFLRESSILSLTMALAIALELFYQRRVAALALFAGAMFLSFSGTGILMLAVALLVPTSRKSLGYALLAIAGFVLLLQVADKIPFLHFWAIRMGEFSRRGSSGYSRFVAPFVFVLSNWLQDIPSVLFGDGPGSYDRTVRPLSLLLRIEVGGGVLTKTIFEYGTMGALLINTLVFQRFYRSGVKLPIKNMLAYTWLFTVVGLTEYFFLFWLFSMWESRSTIRQALAKKPKRRPRASPEAAAEPV